MTLPMPGSVLLCGLLLTRLICAQAADPNLMREATAVRAEVARSLAALRQYTWTEHTEVRVKGDVKSAEDSICRYDSSGQLIRTPAGDAKEEKSASGISKRPMVRKKADTQDYIERALRLIREYVPPKPEQIQYNLEHGSTSLQQPEAGKAAIRLEHYFKEGDAMVFTYDAASKVLLRADIMSSLGPKDPVTMEAVFETLPDGVNHVASTTLTAKSKGVQVITRNTGYQKSSN